MFAADESLRRDLAKAEKRLSAAERRLERAERIYSKLLLADDDLEAAKSDAKQKPSEVLKDDVRSRVIDIENPEEEEDDEGGVAVAVRHRVRWGLEKEFEEWSSDIDAAMRKFPGFLGLDVFQENTATDEEDRVYVGLFRFENVETLQKWTSSDERAKQLLKLEPLVDEMSSYYNLGTNLRVVADEDQKKRLERTERNLLGELLFSENSDDQKKKAPPSLYKVTILTTLGLFLVAFIINAHLPPILEKSIGHDLLVLLVSTLCTVAGNIYFGAPFMTFFFAHWLHQTPSLSSDRSASALTKYLVHGSQSRSLNAALLTLYFAILVLAGLLKQ